MIILPILKGQRRIIGAMTKLETVLLSACISALVSISCIYLIKPVSLPATSAASTAGRFVYSMMGPYIQVFDSQTGTIFIMGDDHKWRMISPFSDSVKDAESQQK